MSSNGPVELVSATTLIKDALGMSRGLAIWGEREIAGAAYDRNKILQQFVEDNDRAGAIKWLLDQKWTNLQSAANRGTEIHQVAEQLALGAVVEYDEILEPYIVQYRRFLEEHQPEFLLAECPVYNFSYRFAGTLDGVAKIAGQTVVLDVKTTAHGPDAKDDRGKLRSRPPFPESAVQLTLYRNAEQIGLLADRKEIQYRRFYVVDQSAHLEPMIPTDGGIVVVVSPADYQVIPVDTGERMWKVCRHIIQVAKFQTETAKTVFGPPIPPAHKVPA